ncbi:MAG: NADH-quinone oxidoreductase subunit L, partial [Nitrospinota bacterium]
LAVAGAGIAVAWYFYIKKPKLADKAQRQFAGIHKIIYNKYYVDEIYNFLITNPIVTVSRAVLYKIVDVKIIDAMVNDTASFFISLSRFVKGVQTGFVRDYALTMLITFVLIAGMYMWGGG